MRYIRFLKTPRIVADKGASKSHVYCLITITSDLGDSFFPHNVELAAELLSLKENPDHDSKEPFDHDEVLLWSTISWTSGMRTLAIKLPLKKSHASKPLLIRIGLEPQSSHDTFDALLAPDAHGIVSAWSAPFNTPGLKEAPKLVQRRFQLGEKVLRVWEETGESIDRHLWDAGITLSHHLASLLTTSPKDPLYAALPTLHPNLKHPPVPNPEDADSTPDLADLHVLELGTGCGIVGLTLASLIPGCSVHMTDLPSAAEIVAQNISSALPTRAPASSTRFFPLDWDHELPEAVSPEMPLALVAASDCTYNADSSPALVATLSRLSLLSNPHPLVAIAMKPRHASEEVFFHLMAEAGFTQTAKLEWDLPGDLGPGEERVELYVYRLGAG